MVNRARSVNNCSTVVKAVKHFLKSWEALKLIDHTNNSSDYWNGAKAEKINEIFLR